MERLLQLICGWIQMLYAAFLVAVAGFNLWRIVVGQYTFVHAMMFTTLLVVSIALLVFSVRDYAKIKQEKEIENNKPRKS